MQTCTNCGATLRPGAKFCTTCGTRMNDMPPANDAYAGWGTPPADTDNDSQETSVFTAVPPAAPQPTDTGSIRGGTQRTVDSWNGAWGDSKPASTASSNDPASRFISALDTEVAPSPASEPPSAQTPASTWETPAPAFTPPPPSNWSYTGGEPDAESANDFVAEVEAMPAEQLFDSSDDAIETENAPATEPAVQESRETNDSADSNEQTDAAGFTDDGDDEVDYLSGDENIEISGAQNPVLPPDEARDRAIALVDELRRMVRMMSSDGESDHGAAAMALTEASLNVGDFSDLRAVLADVTNDPRDIQALSGLAAKVDRIESLIEEHASLVDTIERAITELNGS